MSKVLIVAEHLDGKLNSATARCVTCAQALNAESIDVVVLAADPSSVAAEAAQIAGVSKVLTVSNPANAHALAQVLAPQVARVAAGYSHVFVGSTTFGKDLMPCVAALLGTAQVSDIMAVEGAHTFKRPIYAGNAIITVSAPTDAPVAATVRTASWPAAKNGGSAPVEAVSVDVALPTHTRFVELQQGASDRPDLQSARKVVSGGRALGSADAFSIIYSLADKMGAGVGASRAAVEAVSVDAALPTHTRFVELQQGKRDRPDLQSARKVVSGGRALGSADAFKIIYSLADKMGAAVGASRAAVDAGYVPNELQVGQTGKIIAPELYVAIGISGAIQHLTGIKDAGTIVAINKDGEAPIFEIADFGLVGDLFTILPELEAAL